MLGLRERCLLIGWIAWRGGRFHLGHCLGGRFEDIKLVLVDGVLGGWDVSDGREVEDIVLKWGME